MKKTNLKAIKTSYSTMFIKTPYHNRALEYIARVHETAQSANPKIGLLTGESGSGKTTVSCLYLEDYPEQIMEEYTVKRVVYIKLRTNASIGDIIKAIYFELMGIELRAKGTNADKEAIIVQKLKDMKTELIVIDEAHHAMSGDAVEHTRTGNFMNFLKTVLDDSKTPILLVGMPELKQLRKPCGKRNKSFAEQFKRRSFSACSISNLRFNDIQYAMNNFRKTLEDEGVSCACLEDAQVIAKIFCSSKGSIGIIDDLLQSSIVEQNGRLYITEKSLKNSAYFQFDDEDNAFELKKIGLNKRLIEIVKEAA